MEEEKFHQISENEVHDLDKNKIGYYTLTDGTIVRVKKEGEMAGEVESQITNSAEKIQRHSQIEQRNTYVNSNISSDFLNDEILLPGDNYRYYISTEVGNTMENEEKPICTCKKGYNAQLIETEIGLIPLEQLELKNLSMSQSQSFQQGQSRKQLFKLVQAIPIRSNNISYTRYIKTYSETFPGVCTCVCTCPKVTTISNN